MAYVEPDVTMFKARFPEFDPVSEGLVMLVLAEAVAEVGETWLERDRAPAQMYLAAHKLAMEGEPARTKSGTSIAATGPVKRRKVGDVETEYAGNSASSGKNALGYQSTSYGRSFERLLRANFAGPQIVA